MADFNKDSVLILIELQNRDVAIDKLKTKAAAIPSEIAALRKTIEDEKAKSAAMKAEAQKLAVERKAKEVELASQEESIKKHQGQLNAVKTNDAFKALQHEIDDAKFKKADLEDEILVLMDKVEESARAEKGETKRVAEHAVVIEAQVKEVEAKGAKLQAEVEKAVADRAAMAATAPEDLLKQYESLRSRKKGTALAPIVGNVCGGCNMRLVPQIVVNVKKATKFVSCEGCQRILYSTDAPAVPAEAAAPAGSTPSAPAPSAPPSAPAA